MFETVLSQVPQNVQKPMALRISPVAERALRAGHPWLFSDAIESQSRDGAAGDIAVIFDRKNRFLAAGLYDPYAPIRVQVLVHGRAASIAQPLFLERLQAASALRRPIESGGTNGFRLVHGENDGLGGLVIDRYDRTYVLKLYSAAWLPHLQALLEALVAVEKPLAIVLRFSRRLQQEAPLFGLADGDVLLGTVPEFGVPFAENGLRFEADVIAGQKTGFFLDQRENRKRVEALAKGRRVLNVFSYSGGFSLYAARGGATRVTSLDLSDKALQAAERNFKLNEANGAIATVGHTTLRGDAFDLLGDLAANGRVFDMVILDPPAFARRQESVSQALNAYARLVGLGLGVLQRGGVLVAASCSSRVAADEFFAQVREAARGAGRPLSEIERTGHAPDHPIAFPEGAYLKCLFAYAN